MSDIAIAHDQFRTMGGAERVACEIARALDAPIYAMRVDDGVAPGDVDVRQLAGDWGEWVMHRHYLAQDAYQMLAWQHVPTLYEYDTVIQTKNNPMWWVPDLDNQTLIRYCHSTPRGMFDQFNRRGGDLVSDALATVERLLYQQTTPYADRWLCNSDVVERRLHGYLGPTAPTEVIYPPVDTGSLSAGTAETADYLFVVGRLAVNKRIPLLTDVARRTDKKVVVAGDGPLRDELLAGAPPNLEYLGYISEAEKAKRLSEAQATLMLAESEDFGIVPIESMAAGTPVIGVREGFTEYQITDGGNGYLVEPHVSSVLEAIALLDSSGVAWTEGDIERYADQFSIPRFRAEIQAAVDEAEADATVETGLATPQRAVNE